MKFYRMTKNKVTGIKSMTPKRTHFNQEHENEAKQNMNLIL